MVAAEIRTRGLRRVGPALCLMFAVGALSLGLASPALGAGSGAFGWGYNLRGQLGDGSTEESDVPVSVSGLSGVKAVSAGSSFGLALLNSGTVMAWGENGFGELGNGTHGEFSDVPVSVSGLSEVAAIAAGTDHGLALLSDGKVMAWGYNAFGQLGDGMKGGFSDVPVLVSGLSGVTAIAAGADYSLALLSSGEVVGWGYNEDGELGNGTTTESDVPVKVHGLKHVVAIAAGNGVSSALLESGRMADWGYNGEGQLGNGTEGGFSDVPVKVSGIKTGVALPNGGESMVLLRDGAVMDWGLGSNGRLGNGTEGGSSDVPVAVSGVHTAVAIAGGFEQRFALLQSGRLAAWGANGSGELGNGTTETSDVPVPVKGLGEVTSVAGGQYFSLASGTAIAP